MVCFAEVNGRCQGVIPVDWGQPGAFPSLEFLNIAGNQLKGVLPDMGMGALSKAQVCEMSRPWIAQHLAVQAQRVGCGILTLMTPVLRYRTGAPAGHAAWHSEVTVPV